MGRKGRHGAGIHLRSLWLEIKQRVLISPTLLRVQIHLYDDKAAKILPPDQDSVDSLIFNENYSNTNATEKLRERLNSESPSFKFKIIPSESRKLLKQFSSKPAAPLTATRLEAESADLP